MRDKKTEIRAGLLAQLLSLTQEEVKRRSNRVEHLLSQLPIYRKAKVVLAYFPLKGEVDLLGLIRKDWQNKEFCFPVMDLDAKALRVFKANDLDQGFRRGPYGVMEPSLETSVPVDISRIDLIIVPGLAFDKDKNRLGRGAGFYDRFLKTITPPVAKVGVAFDVQILQDLPNDPAWDEKVDVLVGERSVI